jgi:hypothetical protein
MRGFAFTHARAHRATPHTPTIHLARAPQYARFCSSEIERTLVRSSALVSEPSCDLFRSFLFPPFHFPSRRTAFSPFLSIFLSYPRHPTTISPPKTHGHHLHPSSSHSHCTTHCHRRSHFLISPPFLLFSHPNPTSPNSFFLSIFFSLQRHIPIHGLCHF